MKTFLDPLPDGWSEVSLGSVFEERNERGRADLPLLAITNDRGVLPRDELDAKDSSNPDKSAYKRIAVGDIGYNTMRMWQGVSALSSWEGIVSPAYTICIPSCRIDPLFAAYLFKFPAAVNLFYRHSQGLVDDTRSLKFHHFAQVKLPFPDDIEEQRAIAAHLQAADLQIDLTQRYVQVAKQQKTALMQQFLTGQTRI